MNMEKENRTRMHIKPNSIKETRGYAKKRIFSKITYFLMILGILAIVAAVLLIYFKQPVKTENGYLLSTPSYEIMEHGQKVLIVEDKQANFLTPLKRALFTQTAYYGKIIAGPYGEVQQVNGGYRVSDGTNVISINAENPPEYLDMQYVAREIDETGELKKDKKDVVLNKEEILGKMIE